MPNTSQRNGTFGSWSSPVTVDICGSCLEKDVQILVTAFGVAMIGIKTSLVLHRQTTWLYARLRLVCWGLVWIVAPRTTADTASLATRSPFSKLVGVATLVGFVEKRCRKNLSLGGFDEW